MKLLWLAVAAALPSLLALAVFGVISKHDSLGYIAYANEIRALGIPSGSALLDQSPIPTSLFRIGGFPAILALLQSVAPQNWPALLVTAQISVQSVIAILTYKTALKLGATPKFSVAAALLPAFGFAAVVNICILTDSLYSALITGAAFILISYRSWRSAVIAGLMIAVAASFREVTIFLVLAFIPLAILQKQRWLCIALIVLPTWGVAAAQISWNISRGAGPVMTTSAQITMVQAVLPLLKNHLPVYDSDTTFDHIATSTVGAHGYDGINAMQSQLFQSGFTAPQIAKIAAGEYFRTWRRWPLAMLSTSLSNYNDGFLAMSFEPLDVTAFLLELDDFPRPEFTRLNRVFYGAIHGNVQDILYLIFEISSRLIGSAIGLYGLLSPWFYRNTSGIRWDLRALWCVPVGLAGLYMPVHLEYRYLLPGVPIICALAAVGLSQHLMQAKQPPPVRTEVTAL